MTMGEFRVYKNGNKNITNGPPVGGPANDTNVKQPPAVSRKPEVREIPEARPVRPVQKPPIKQWTDDDHKSPLEGGDVKEARKQEVVKTVLPESRGDAFDAVIKNLKFPVADELRPRLKSLIVSRVKDIRTDEQVVEYATRAVVNGGLGLTEAQAGELAGAIGMKTPEHKNIKTSEPVASVLNPKPEAESRVDRLQDTGYKLQEHRPIMHDIIAPAAPKEEVKASVGPIEELQMMTLTDFRRLSPNPAQAGEILLGKFTGLKQESYLLFLKAVQSWYNSPLYKQYQQIIADAINGSVKIKDALGQMKEEEYKVIVKLCNNL